MGPRPDAACVAGRTVTGFTLQPLFVPLMDTLVAMTGSGRGVTPTSNPQFSIPTPSTPHFGDVESPARWNAFSIKLARAGYEFWNPQGILSLADQMYIRAETEMLLPRGRRFHPSV